MKSRLGLFDTHFQEKYPKLDYFIVSNLKNIQWLTGFSGSAGLFVWKKNAKNSLILDGRYSETGKNISQKLDLNLEDYHHFFSQENFFPPQTNCGLDENIKITEFENFKKKFPKTNFETILDATLDLRQTKNEQELQNIATAQNHVDSQLISCLESELATDTTEQLLAWKIEMALRNNGNFDLSFPVIVAFGENSSRPHHLPSSRKLKAGDNILIDCGVKFNGYCSDMTRNFIWKKSSSEIQNAYKILQKAQHETCQQVFPGKKISDLDKFCRDSLGDMNKYFVHSLGHGVGLDIHERPSIFHKNKEKLQLNEVITIEPGIYFPGKFGLRLEDIGIVRDDGFEILSKTSDELIIFS